MIVRIQASGGSFLGAGKYYLHDKLDAERAARAAGGERIGMGGQSDERVWFTDTRNCLNTDPERALEEMWHTAGNQAHLKMQAGVKRGGRVCEDPVKTISLSWHRDDRPDVQHMVDSADDFLKHMGWDKHQAVYVGHNDTEHRHIHIILNRINPENGRTLDDYREQKRSQVWALAYEKERDNVRCEERELRAARREGREPELNENAARDWFQSSGRDTAQPVRAPANDHLPHNVIMISRPLEREFGADEAARAAQLEQERLQLKAHQRADREAYFKDGAKLFKAARHAVYDEVRREFRSEWRDFYRDARAAGFTAEDARDTAVREALDLARDGKWQHARTRFEGRDAAGIELAEAFAARRADIEERQKAAITERQRDACDALRAIRDVQYQELLERQRDERTAVRAGATLERAGHTPLAPSEITALAQSIANENLQPPASRTVEAEIRVPAALEQPELGAVDLASVPGVDRPAPSAPEVPEVTHQVSDLAAGAIGSVASYLADQLGEFFAPTPPEQREQNARAENRAVDSQQPGREIMQSPQNEKRAAYARMIEAAVKAIEQDRQQKGDQDYWKDRDRGKGWERDR